MAGSYRHIVDEDNDFRGTDLIKNLGDVYEALEECYAMIKYLSGGDKVIIHEAWLEGYIKEQGIVPGETHSFREYWDRDE